MCVPSQADRQKGQIVHDPMNSPKWARVSTYGGSLLNNIVQGFCRDFLAGTMLSLDSRGASIVLHTHDEPVIEALEVKADGVRAAMEVAMRTVPAWAQGFPLFAKVKTMRRYGK
jgi:DNA polymerase